MVLNVEDGKNIGISSSLFEVPNTIFLPGAWAPVRCWSGWDLRGAGIFSSRTLGF